MSILKSKPIAIIIAAVLVIGSTFLGAKISLEKEAREVMDLFYEGVEYDGYVHPSIYSQLEKRADAVRLIRENLEVCHLTENARVHNGDALAYLRSGEKFDLIFLDPPYDSTLLDQALETITAFDICRAHGIIVAESALEKVLPPLAPPYRLYREYRYGKIKLTVYHRDGNED